MVPDEESDQTELEKTNGKIFLYLTEEISCSNNPFCAYVVLSFITVICTCLRQDYV